MSTLTVGRLDRCRATAPRFQRHHTTTLIGPWPEHACQYQQRSVLHHAHRIHAPVLLVHGEHDHITPAEPTARLHAAGTPCTLQLHPAKATPCAPTPPSPQP